MQFSSIISIAAIAGFAVSTPVNLPSDLTARDNCTTYSSTNAGTVCYHTPSDCSATYLVQAGETCHSIAAQFNNFTLAQFYYWNPDVQQTCLGLRAYVPVCINTPWYTFTPPIQPPDGTVSTFQSGQVAFPVMPSITANCKRFEFIGANMVVATVIAQNNITLDAFLSWNAYIDRVNLVMWKDYWVCVGA